MSRKALFIAALLASYGQPLPIKNKNCLKNEKPEFTDNELGKLSSLHGQDKKLYIKFLKEKYRKGPSTTEGEK